jgi:hypothetical protein
MCLQGHGRYQSEVGRGTVLSPASLKAISADVRHDLKANRPLILFPSFVRPK